MSRYSRSEEGEGTKLYRGEDEYSSFEKWLSSSETPGDCSLSEEEMSSTPQTARKEKEILLLGF